jgi:spore germination protein YaaH
MNILKFLEKNNNYFFNFNLENINKKYLKEIQEQLNKEKLIIVSGFK